MDSILLSSASRVGSEFTKELQKVDGSFRRFDYRVEGSIWKDPQDTIRI